MKDEDVADRGLQRRVRRRTARLDRTAWSGTAAAVGFVVGVVAATGGCAERARAAPAQGAACVSARDVEIVARRPGESGMRITAEVAVLAPGFPSRVSGTFEGAQVEAGGDAPKEPGGEVVEPPAPEGDGDEERLSVRARRMHYDARSDSAVFTGAVELRLGALALRSDRVEVTYRRAEGVADFMATGSVRIEREDMAATAGKAQYDGVRRILELTDSPRVEGPVGTLEGARIVLALREETITVEEVRGRFDVRRIRGGARSRSPAAGE